MRLSQLPTELLVAIATELHSALYISRLSQTSKRIHVVLDRFIYHYDSRIRHGNKSSAVGQSRALCWAAYNGNLSVVKKALNAGANINGFAERNNFYGGLLRGRSPLQVAIIAGDDDMVRELLALNADANQRNGSGDLPIFDAISVGSLSIFKCIFESRGFQPPDKTVHLGPLLEAAVYGNNSAIVVYLMNALDKPGAHHYSTQGLLHIATMLGKLELTRHLLGNRRIDPGPLPWKLTVWGGVLPGESAFSIACRNGYLEIVKLLFYHGVDVNTVDSRGMSPLTHALTERHDDVSFFLLDDPSCRVDYEVEYVFRLALYRLNTRVILFCINSAEMSLGRSQSWSRLAKRCGLLEIVGMIEWRYRQNLAFASI